MLAPFEKLAMIAIPLIVIATSLQACSSEFRDASIQGTAVIQDDDSITLEDNQLGITRLLTGSDGKIKKDDFKNVSEINLYVRRDSSWRFGAGEDLSEKYYKISDLNYDDQENKCTFDSENGVKTLPCVYKVIDGDFAQELRTELHKETIPKNVTINFNSGYYKIDNLKGSLK